MSSQENQQRYTRVAIYLHWAIALFILFNMVTGTFMESLEPPLKFIIIWLHISSGMTVFGLTFVRIAWRLTHRPPPFSFDLSPLERRLAHAVHIALYVLMVAMPLSGWLLISANIPGRGPPLFIWNIIPLPWIAAVHDIGATTAGAVQQKIIHDQFVELHYIGAWIMLASLLLHVAGALKHQFIDRHAQFIRMGVGRGRNS